MQYPFYFNPRGDLKKAKKPCVQLIRDWISKTNNGNQTDGTWTMQQMTSILRDGARTLANQIEGSLVNKKGELSNTDRKSKKVVDVHDGATGKFKRVDQRPMSTAAQDRQNLDLLQNPINSNVPESGKKQRIPTERKAPREHTTAVAITMYPEHEDRDTFLETIQDLNESKKA